MKLMQAVRCVMTLIAASVTATSSTAGQFGVVKKLIASDARQDDQFGQSLSVHGNRAIVGSTSDEGAGAYSGSAYLFDVSTGAEILKLTASDAAADDLFGISVGIGGGKAIVGAIFDDDGGSNAGAAYIFEVATGAELLKLTASDATPNDRFGRSVAISGSNAIVGGRRFDNPNYDTGAAYLFDVATGAERFKLTSSPPGQPDAFGNAVAISGSYAIVGAHQDGGAGAKFGAAYLFNVATGAQLFKLSASDAYRGDLFGEAVAISGDTALVGAPWDDNSTGSAYLFDVKTGAELFKLTASDSGPGRYFGGSVSISGNLALISADGHNNDRGAVYLFDVTTGKELLRLVADDGAVGDRFGDAVAMSGPTAIIGARLRDDNGQSSGAAYLFIPEPSSLPLAVFAACCSALQCRKCNQMLAAHSRNLDKGQAR